MLKMARHSVAWPFGRVKTCVKVQLAFEASADAGHESLSRDELELKRERGRERERPHQECEPSSSLLIEPMGRTERVNLD